MEEKFEPLEKTKKQFTLRRNFSQQPEYPFNHKRNEEILEEVKVETVDKKLKKIQIKLAMTCNMNEQQKDAKNNADL